MAVDHIRYDVLAQQALRGVVRTVLAEAAKSGLPGEHHFYIAFDTKAPVVRLSARMREQYPQEMTIILQHQFWDLAVNNEGFEVGLSFGGVPERVAVPFSAVKGFFDPSVQFGLQFEANPTDEAGKGDTAESPAPLPRSDASTPVATTPAVSVPPRPPAAAPAAEQRPAPRSRPKPKSKPEPAATSGSEQPPTSGGAQVVSLDRFRKK